MATFNGLITKNDFRSLHSAEDAKKEYARLRRVRLGVYFLGADTSKVDAILAYLKTNWLSNTRGNRGSKTKN